jgi:hypothetical protein
VQVKLNRGLDFVQLDDLLIDLKLTPDVLEVPVPRYFIEDRAQVGGCNDMVAHHSDGYSPVQQMQEGPAVLAHPVHVVDTGALTQHVQYGLWVGLHKKRALPPASTNALLCTQLGVTYSSSTQQPG